MITADYFCKEKLNISLKHGIFYMLSFFTTFYPFIKKNEMSEVDMQIIEQTNSAKHFKMKKKPMRVFSAFWFVW